MVDAPFNYKSNQGGQSFSLEAGKSFTFETADPGLGWFVEPRLQYLYSRAGGYAVTRNNIDLKADDYVSSLGSLGVNLGLQIEKDGG